MTDDQNLDLIVIKNRPWLLVLIIPTIFVLFILTFTISSIFSVSGNVIWFYMAFIIFLLELQLVKIGFSKFRYVADGKLTFNGNGIFSSKSFTSFSYNWETISELKFYYRGDWFWKFQIGRIIFNRGKRRYYNLRWFGNEEMDKKIIDRIDINGETKYLKIRNEKEKEIFYRLISIAKEKGCNMEEMETDFTTSLFGRKIDIMKFIK